MAFVDHIAREDLALTFYATISGLPVIWSLGPNPWGGPTEVMLGRDGALWETYTWCERLAPSGTWATVAQKVEPWAGIGTCGQVSLELLLPGNQSTQDAENDPLMGLLMSPTIFRGLTAVLTGDLAVNGLTANVDTIAGWAAPGEIYCGLETMSYAGLGAASFTGLVRGRYWSQPLPFVASPDGIEETGIGGPYICDHPLVLKGRVVRIWASPGYVDQGGTYIPYGAAPLPTSEDRMVYCGVISGYEVASDWSKVSIETEDISRFLTDTYLRRQPKAKAGVPAGHVQIAEDNCWIAWSWSWQNATTGLFDDTFQDTHSSVLLDRGTGLPVPYGVYTIGYVSDCIDYTMQLQPGTLNAAYGGVPSYSLSVIEDDDGKTRITLRASIDPGIVVVPSIGVCLTLYRQIVDFSGTVGAGEGSLWRTLGFERIQRGETQYTGFGVLMNVSIQAENLLPCFEFPGYGDAGINSTYRRVRLYYHSPSGPAFQLAILTDDDGVTQDTFVRVGEEILGVCGSGSETTPDGIPVTWLEVRNEARGCFGSQMVDHRYDASTKEDLYPEIVQGIGLTNISLGYAALILMESGSGVPGANGAYDFGYRGWGACIDSALIDETSFIALVNACGDASKIEAWLGEEGSIGDFLGNELVKLQSFAIPTWDAAAGWFRIAAKMLTEPQESDYNSAWALSHDNVDSKSGIGWKVDESRLVNVIRGTNFGFDPCREKSDIKCINWRQGTSIGTWGEADPIEIDMRHCSKVRNFATGAASGSSSTAMAETRFREAAEALAGHWSVPFALLEVSVTRAWAWQVQVGDLVRLTHESIPSVNAIGWGVTDLLGRVFGISNTYYHGKERSRITLIAQHGGWRLSAWSPSACAHAVGGGALQLTVYDRRYSDASQIYDVENFEVGDVIKLYNPGNEAGREIRQIQAITMNPGADADVITLTAPTALAAPIIIEYAPYSTAAPAALSAQQKRFVFMDDSDRILNLPLGATDPPYWYQ